MSDVFLDLIRGGGGEINIAQLRILPRRSSDRQTWTKITRTHRPGRHVDEEDRR